MAVSAKVCGITRPSDAAFAAAHGAWRVGVIFAGGPREIDPPTARRIVDAAGGVPVIGVFGSGTPQTILRKVADAGLAGVQLHGAFSASDADALASDGLEVWQVARFNDPGALEREAVRIGTSGTRVLIEPRVPGGGGQGVALPDALATLGRQRFRGRFVVLAGGLGPETVANAIRVVGPDAVDVSSGVEVAPGIKDPVRLVAFLEAVRDARPAA